ncbi:MAG TPA: hypothetical protein VIY48_07425 [Candidatus Paceibacterota bacterium]
MAILSLAKRKRYADDYTYMAAVTATQVADGLSRDEILALAAEGLPIKGETKMAVVNGYKTYIVASFLLGCVVLHFMGYDVPGFNIDSSNWLDYVMTAFGLGALRSAVKKAE